MELTETEIFLLDGLIIFGVERGAIVGILSVLETEEQQMALVEWLAEHPEIIDKNPQTTSDVLGQVARIAKEIK